MLECQRSLSTCSGLQASIQNSTCIIIPYLFIMSKCQIERSLWFKPMGQQMLQSLHSCLKRRNVGIVSKLHMCNIVRISTLLLSTQFLTSRINRLTCAIGLCTPLKLPTYNNHTQFIFCGIGITSIMTLCEQRKCIATSNFFR